ncbi:hypothetical protein TMatcc_003467 [Talaromyces marneffei ATCC 18224]
MSLCRQHGGQKNECLTEVANDRMVWRGVPAVIGYPRSREGPSLSTRTATSTEPEPAYLHTYL